MNDLKTRFPRYAKLLQLYPAAYRKRYENELLQTTADMLDHADGRLERFGIWTQVTVDLSANIVRQQLSYAGGAIAQTMPRYIKRSSLVSSALLLPFFAALMGNALGTIITGRNLYHSWVWSAPILTTWILLFPLAALFVAGISYAVYLVRNAPQQSLRKKVFDVVNSWPLLLSGLAACSILLMFVFHDSVQCWSHGPATHFQVAMQCTASNSVNPVDAVKRAFGL